MTFHTRSYSNGGMLQLLVNMIMSQNLPASCNFTGSDVLLIRISAKFDVDLCMTFLKFEACGIQKDLVNAITLHNLLTSSCSFTGSLSASR